MGLFELLVVIIVLAVVWWLLNGYVLPLLPEPVRGVVIIVLVIVALLFFLGLIGIGPGIKLQ